MHDFDRDIYCLLGLPFDAVNMAGAVRRVSKAAGQRTPCYLSTPNLNFLIACQTDSRFRESVINATFARRLLVLVGIAFVMAWSQWLMRFKRSWLAYLGHHSMEIYLVHIIAGSGIRVVLHKFLRVAFSSAAISAP